jgi:hypothetical protein
MTLGECRIGDRVRVKDLLGRVTLVEIAPRVSVSPGALHFMVPVISDFSRRRTPKTEWNQFDDLMNHDLEIISIERAEALEGQVDE